MTWRAGRRPAPVIFASPVSQPPSVRQASSSSGPAARWIAPSTPPPPSRLEFAALTITSAPASVVMSPRCRVMAPTRNSVARDGGYPAGDESGIEAHHPHRRRSAGLHQHRRRTVGDDRAALVLRPGGDVPALQPPLHP